MTKFPGWRTMTGAQRRNAKMEAIFARSWELKAKAKGWTFDKPANEYRLNDNGNGYEAIAPAHYTWYDICHRFHIC